MGLTCAGTRLCASDDVYQLGAYCTEDGQCGYNLTCGFDHTCSETIGK
jgi:hypothetical protein